MKRIIDRLLDADEVCHAKTGAAIPYLHYREKGFHEPSKVVSTGAEDATLEELVELCDQDAESRNAHDFCGAHRVLGGLLFHNLGREVATRLMREIAIRGGLQGMNGVCCDGDAYKEFGVGKSGYNWGGTYGAKR